MQAVKPKRIRINIVLNFVYSIVPIAVALITVPIYIHLVGAERYGILSLVWVLAGYVGFVNFGTGDAIIHRVAEMAGADPAEREHFVWSGLWTSLCLAGAAAVLVWLLGEPAIRQSVRASPALLSEIHASVPWLMLTVLSSFVYSAIAGVIEGVERFTVVNIARVIEGLLGALLPIGAALLFGPALQNLVAVTMLAVLLPAVGLFLYLLRQLPLTRIHLPRWRDTTSIMGFGGWLTVTAVIGPIINTFDRFVVAGVLGPAAVAHYVVPQGIVNRFTALPAAFARTLFPRLATFSDKEGATSLSGSAVCAVAAIIAPLCCGAIILIGPFLAHWISADFATLAAPAARMLLVAIFFNAIAVIPFNHMRGTGNAKVPALIYVVEAVPFLAMAWVLVQQFGIFGAALSWLIRNIVDFLVMFGFAKLDSRDLLRILPLTGPLALAFIIGSQTYPLIPTVIASFAVSGVAALIGLLVSRELRGVVLSILAVGLRWRASF